MQKITKVCDLCGAEWVDYPEHNIFDEPIFNISVKMPYFVTFQQLDLCGDCSEKLFEWLAKTKVEEERRRDLNDR